MRLATSISLLAVLALAAPAGASDSAVIHVDPNFNSTDPGSTSHVFGWVANSGDTVLASPELHFRFPSDIRPTDPYPMYGWTCTTAVGRIDCAGQSLAAKSMVQFSFGLEIPADHPGGLVPLDISFMSAAASTSLDVKVPVTERFFVTSTGDSGNGSLRAAIEDVNARCTGLPACKVYFQLGSGGLLPRIEPLTPLPAMTVTNVILGANDFSYPAEVAEPLVELNGSRLSSGNGLVLRGNQSAYTQSIDVRRMVINGFPENGILIDESAVDSRYSIVSNRIGTDSTGTRPVPNGLRGITVNGPRASSYIALNVIAGNRASGIAVWRTAWTSIEDNWIGVARNGQPLSNGASGIYVAATAANCQVTGGVIAFNHDFGVGIGRGARNVYVANAAVAENLANDVDWNLDGATLLSDDSVPEPPLIISATYDPATNTTTFRGQLHGFQGRYGNYFRVTIYASNHVTRWGVTPMTNFAGGTHVRGFHGAGSPPEFIEPWEITTAGDYRGAFVSAQTVAQDWPDLPGLTTSELGPAVKVE